MAKMVKKKISFVKRKCKRLVKSIPVLSRAFDFWRLYRKLLRHKRELLTYYSFSLGKRASTMHSTVILSHTNVFADSLIKFLNIIFTSFFNDSSRFAQSFSIKRCENVANFYHFWSFLRHKMLKNSRNCKENGLKMTIF